jgi:hypothetical protein
MAEQRLSVISLLSREGVPKSEPISVRLWGRLGEVNSRAAMVAKLAIETHSFRCLASNRTPTGCLYRLPLVFYAEVVDIDTPDIAAFPPGRSITRVREFSAHSVAKRSVGKLHNICYGRMLWS